MFRLRVSRVGLAVMAVLAMVLAMAPIVSAHAADADGGGVCFGTVKIVVFDGQSQTGADDDLCFNPDPRVPWSGDPHFSQNNTGTIYIPDDDIGNRYLMAGFVSSISIRNDSSFNLCVRYYADPNYGGWSESTSSDAGTHVHQNFIAWHDNLYDSIKVYNGAC